MKILAEFYRIRQRDDAHAAVGRETDEAVDLGTAIDLTPAIAWQL